MTTTTTDALDRIEEWAHDVRKRADDARAEAGPEDRYLRGLSDGRVLTVDVLLELVTRLRAGAR